MLSLYTCIMCWAVSSVKAMAHLRPGVPEPHREQAADLVDAGLQDARLHLRLPLAQLPRELSALHPGLTASSSPLLHAPVGLFPCSTSHAPNCITNSMGSLHVLRMLLRY